MAVFPFLPDIEVDILVHGEPLKEYDEPPDVDNGEPKTIVKYIEAVSDSNFEIRLHLNSAYQHRGHGVDADKFMDGVRVYTSLFLRKEVERLSVKSLTEINKEETYGSGNDWKVAKFSFADLKIGKLLLKRGAQTLTKS